MTDDDRALLRLRALLGPAACALVDRHPLGWIWSQPLPPRRFRPGKGAAEPDDPEPEVMAAGSCRWCHEPVDVRESTGDPDGGWSHLACWAAAGHPDVGWAAKLASGYPFGGPTLPPFPFPSPPGTPWRPRP